MPIFAQRRLNLMLNELSSFLDANKLSALKKCVEHIDTNTALAAEAELSVLWAISKVAHLIPEPALPNSSRVPDAISENLFVSKSAVIEVRALSDSSFSGKEAMDRTANIISSFADQLRKGAGKHLYFEFNERSYWTTRFHRERCVDPDFKLDAEIKSILKKWIQAPDWPNPESIRILNGKTDATIRWVKSTVRHFRTRCRMPAVAYDLEDNPIYKALKKKAAQVKGAAMDKLRCIILVDAGCGIIRNLRPMSHAYEVGGEAIIRHALKKHSIDVVIVLSPFRRRELVFSARSELIWNVTCFDRREKMPVEEYDKIKALAAVLPRPRFEGYQARDLHKQGMFSDKKSRWHLPTNITHGGGKMTIKLSAKILHDYLAGRINLETFIQEAFNGNRNYFMTELERGNTIREVQFLSGGVDEDDDYVVFNLDIDWDKLGHRSKDLKGKLEGSE